MFKKFLALSSAVFVAAAGFTAAAVSSASALSNDASLNVTSSVIKGVAIGISHATTCLDGPTCASMSSNQSTITIPTSQANSSAYATTFVPTDSAHASIVKVVKNVGAIQLPYNLTIFNQATAMSSTDSVSDSDVVVVEVQAQDGTQAFYAFKISAASSDATLSTSSTIKGVAITSFGTGQPSIQISGSEGSITLTTAQAADTSNAGNFVTHFIKNDPTATLFHYAKYASSDTYTGSSFIATPNYTSAAISNGDIFIIEISAQNMTLKYWKIIVTVSDSSSQQSSQQNSQQNSQQSTIDAAQVAAIAAAKAKAAAQSTLVTSFAANKPVKVTDFAAAGIPVASQTALTRVTADIANLPAAQRTDLAAIAKVVQTENFVDKVATPATHKAVTTVDLVQQGLVDPSNPNKASIVLALQKADPSSLTSLADIQAKIKAAMDAVAARKARTAAIIAKIEGRTATK